MAENEKITFRMSTVEQIALDAHAQSAGLNRTDFIKRCIEAQLQKDRIDKELKRDESDLQKVYRAITELNVTVVAVRDQLETLDNQKMKRVFEQLKRLGV
jgi:uncharacterized protein (DUF1778 family)